MPCHPEGEGVCLDCRSMDGAHPARFVEKWRGTELSERGASQEHFIDLCRLLGQPTPAEVDKKGAEYAFEKGVADLTDPEAASKSKTAPADHAPPRIGLALPAVYSAFEMVTLLLTTPNRCIKQRLP